MVELPKKSRHRVLIDLTGLRVGKWTVVERLGTTPYWECVCDCGEKRVIAGRNLRSGVTKSCGCSRKDAALAARAAHGAEWMEKRKNNAATAGPKRTTTAYAEKMRAKLF